MLFPNFVTAISVVVLPKLAARFANGGGRAMPQPVAMFTAVFGSSACAVSVCLWLAGAPVLSKLFGNNYSEYANLLPVLCCNAVLITLSQGVQVAIRAMNAPREIFRGFLLASLFTCTVGIAMTSIWQLTGATVALCLSTLVFLIFVTFRFRALVRSRTAAG
jgi:O-antigen/teichoic acid export membrane protein